MTTLQDPIHLLRAARRLTSELEQAVSERHQTRIANLSGDVCHLIEQVQQASWQAHTYRCADVGLDPCDTEVTP